VTAASADVRTGSPARPFDVAVVGGGPWGVALARTAARAGSRVVLVSRRSVDVPEPLTIRPDVVAASEATLLVLAVPSAHVTVFAQELGPHLDGSHLVIHGVRGLVGEDLATVGDILRRHTPVRRLGALAGPTLVPELEAGTPSVMVVGSEYPEVLAAFRTSFACPNLRVYTTHDRIGLEWASAVNGAYLIALGYALASGAGPGLVAAFTTRAVHELARVAVAAGGEAETLLGLAGLGDLLAGINQTSRPEVLLGKALAEGKSVAEGAAAAGQRIEAITLLPHLVAWTQKRKVRASILAGTADAVLGGKSRDELIAALMAAPMEG
jgi:glycerol-3-phosphate dehydrogenase (NAD(P)+)